MSATRKTLDPLLYSTTCSADAVKHILDLRQGVRRQGKKDPNSKGGGGHDKEKGAAVTQVKINREPLA